MRMDSSVTFPPCTASPEFGNMVHHRRDGLGVFVNRPEIPALCEFETAFKEVFGKHEVTAKRLENKLPWQDRAWVSKSNRMTADTRPHDVGNQLVMRPIAATNYIST